MLTGNNLGGRSLLYQALIAPASAEEIISKPALKHSSQHYASYHSLVYYRQLPTACSSFYSPDTSAQAEGACADKK
jgi:hypothetical protein